ncbi:MAG: hypothetical protein AVDCRST_MAG80-683, partial [uncultured Rubrobacteraceae bacterium]
GPEKKIGGCERTRPVVEGRLAGARRRADRRRAIGVRGRRDGVEHLAFLPLRTPGHPEESGRSVRCRRATEV